MHVSGTGFVGRQHEMMDLASALGSTLSGQGQTVMLAGEPGIGKTRTAAEFATTAKRHGATVWSGRCLEGEGVLPYWPWIQPIRSYVRDTDEKQIQSEMGEGAIFDVFDFQLETPAKDSMNQFV